MFAEKLSSLLTKLMRPQPKYITVTPVTSAPELQLPPDHMPGHVAIIMDGNGRWAQNRGLSRSAGHAAGTEALRDIIRASDEWGIKALSVYAFSTENWSRSKEEVGALMGLLLKYFSSEIDELDEKNVCIRILGDVEGLPEAQRSAVKKAMARTELNTGLKLNIALNYGGHAELIQAAQALARKVAAGEMTADEINAESFEDELYTRDLPPVDLLIRTSGEVRTSNFLPWQTAYAEMIFDPTLWQTAYAEMIFDPTLWPDYDRAHYLKNLREYAARDRRFGGVKPSTEQKAEVND